jgi:RNA polymerase sigma factor (sigma-70 family)
VGDRQRPISVAEYERTVFEELEDERAFFSWLDKNKDRKLELDYPLAEADREDIRPSREEEVIDYLEEIARYAAEDETEPFLQNAGQVALLGFHYLRGGSSYLDILQEGNIGLISAIERYGDSGFTDFSNYRNFFIIREMVLSIKRRLLNIQSEFGSFFQKRRDHLSGHGHQEEEDDEDGEISAEALLNSIESIREKEEALKEKIDFFRIKNRLNNRDIDVLQYYFGFGKEKRYSIYEIENELRLPRGDGEEIFERAIAMLSTTDGRILI